MHNLPIHSSKNRHRSIYLLPNAFTTSALFAGFYAVVQAIDSQFEISAIAIFIAMLFDGLDGRIARLTNTQSSFGEQYDSLSDMISFGMAPALIIYEWTLNNLGRWGWLATFVYVAGTALRLARFNSNECIDKRFFQGLPSPGAAALIVGFVWLGVDRNFPSEDIRISWLSFLLTIYSGITMVINIPFFSGKDISFGNRIPFWGVLLIVITFVFISSDPPIVLFSFFVLYSFSGWIIYIWRWEKAKKIRRKRANQIFF
ncbi:MAG: CDP-diacylglycerol--serine O-phosphatidyltransferase [Bordetella sp.]|nr:MAG: CDP-diacylglycerol--serine O-phosphatidyltransferase [Bordetella sp.]